MFSNFNNKFETKDNFVKKKKFSPFAFATSAYNDN